MEHTHEKHEHHHGECCCGHKHGNHHHTHEYYHSHEHVQHVHKYEQHIHKEQFLQVSKSVKQSIYILENLGCANCAAKMEKKINIVLEKAVKGMLPHNTLGADMFRKLKAYKGSEHPHQAQQPKEIKIKGDVLR